MSNLVLPTAYENKQLEANLQAFFTRYPYERARLEPLLSKPVRSREAIKIELPPVPSSPPLRAIILAGIGSPQFLCDLLNNPYIKEETYQIYVIENDSESLAFYFQNFDLRPVINHEKTEWLLLHNLESIKPALFRILKRESTASMMRCVSILEPEIPKPDDVKAFYSQLANAYNETVHHVFHNFGRIDDSLEGVRATLLNKDVILSNPGINDLKGAFKGVPALIIGAGPSVDRELATIKANNDKFVVIAVDASLKPLLKAGIRVDYITSIERLNDYQKPFFEGLGPIDTELVAFPVVHPELFPLYSGPIRLCYRNYSYFAYFEKSWPKGIIKCGGSTSHLALRLADWMGCPKAFLIGLDSCYEKQENSDLYRSHCDGTGYENWGQFVPLSDFSENRKHLPPMKAIANDGSEITTNLTYYQWGKEYTEELSEVCHRITVINCSTKGLRFEGIPYKPLNELLAPLDDVFPGKPKRPTVEFNRTYSHKEIVRNFDSWKTMCEDIKTECDELLKQEIVDPARYEAIIFLYNFRICIDPLFVAFIIQCCAKEFFEFENQWWALNKSWTADLKEKIQVTKDRLSLFSNVLTQLQALFKEAHERI